MPVVTLEQSQSMAAILLKKKENQLAEEGSALKKEIRAAFMETVPESLKKAMSHTVLKKYILTSNRIRLDIAGVPYNHKEVNLEGEDVPILASHSWSQFVDLQLNDKNIENKWINHKSKVAALAQLKKKTEGILKGLRTHKRVVEEFPELESYLKTTIKKRELVAVGGLKTEIEKFPEGVK